MDLDKEIVNAMQVVSNLARDAKEVGEETLAYAANRAWHQLYNARELRAKNRARRVSNGDR
jgi:hypothetical protein